MGIIRNIHQTDGIVRLVSVWSEGCARIEENDHRTQTPRGLIEKMNVRPPYDSILVEVESEWKSETTTKSGVIAVAFENDIDRSAGAQRTGRIIATPLGISDHYYLKDVKERPEVGDIAYFHFNAISPDSRLELTLFGKPYYLVHMESIFALVRNGQTIMFGGRVLCEPLYDDDVVDEGGIKVRKTKSGIISELNVGHNLKKARLTNIGNPLGNDEVLDVKPGDIVYYAKDADFENEIEGRKVFCMMQEDLLFKEITE